MSVFVVTRQTTANHNEAPCCQSKSATLRADFEDNFVNGDHDNYSPVWIPHVPVVVLSDYQKGTLNNIQAMITSARAHGCQVLIDPGANFAKISCYFSHLISKSFVLLL